MKTLQQHIDEVMDWLNFEKIHKVMVFLDWQWADEGVPGIPEMRKHVREYMTALYNRPKNTNDGRCSQGSGGFMVEYTWGIDDSEIFDHFEVRFELAEWYTGQ